LSQKAHSVVVVGSPLQAFVDGFQYWKLACISDLLTELALQVLDGHLVYEFQGSWDRDGMMGIEWEWDGQFPSEMRFPQGSSA
jgi:hypothetical protein